jgi:hypothetical protein
MSGLNELLQHRKTIIDTKVEAIMDDFKSQLTTNPLATKLTTTIASTNPDLEQLILTELQHNGLNATVNKGYTSKWIEVTLPPLHKEYTLTEQEQDILKQMLENDEFNNNDEGNLHPFFIAIHEYVRTKDRKLLALVTLYLSYHDVNIALQSPALKPIRQFLEDSEIKFTEIQPSEEHCSVEKLKANWAEVDKLITLLSSENETKLCLPLYKSILAQIH